MHFLGVPYVMELHSEFTMKLDMCLTVSYFSQVATMI